MTDEDSSKDLLNIPAEYATRVFVNSVGSVTISQDDTDDRYTQFIVLSKSQAEHVYLALQAFVEGN